MDEKNIWFKGHSRTFWMPVSNEGWVISALFFVCLFLIGKINHVSSQVNLTATQIFPMLIEFGILLGFFYFITKGHIDKSY